MEPTRSDRKRVEWRCAADPGAGVRKALSLEGRGQGAKPNVVRLCRCCGRVLEPAADAGRPAIGRMGRMGRIGEQPLVGGVSDFFLLSVG